MATTGRTWRSNTSRFALFKRNSIEKTPLTTSASSKFSVPTYFQCPISLELMKDPVTLSTGITYDRESIETWLQLGNFTCPVTKQVVNDSEELVPNHALRKMIQDWCVANLASGVERIPTPKVPVTPFQASELLSEFASACRRGEYVQCRELVRKIKSIIKESERNRKTVIMCGASQVLSASFCDLASANQLSLNADILSALSLLFPLCEDASHNIASPKSLNAIVSILNSGDLAARFSAVLALKDVLVSSSSESIYMVAVTEGLIEELVKIIERPISPQTTKASLLVIYYLVSSNEKIAERFVRMGLVPILLEILVDSDKSMTEKGLVVLDAVISSKTGKELASRHALTVPVLVKKMNRVSDIATEFAVSALWQLCKGSMGKRCLSEALQVGVFQKLLVLLQVGCKLRIKEKVSELLKLSNASRDKLECIDTVDFKGLKRPF